MKSISFLGYRSERVSDREIQSYKTDLRREPGQLLRWIWGNSPDSACQADSGFQDVLMSPNRGAGHSD